MIGNPFRPGGTRPDEELHDDDHYHPAAALLE